MCKKISLSKQQNIKYFINIFHSGQTVNWQLKLIWTDRITMWPNYFIINLHRLISVQISISNYILFYITTRLKYILPNLRVKVAVTEWPFVDVLKTNFPLYVTHRRICPIYRVTITGRLTCNWFWESNLYYYIYSTSFSEGNVNGHDNELALKPKRNSINLNIHS